MGLLQEGQKIRDKWEVERFLGEGAFAEVYRIRHRFFGRQAMKILKLTGITKEEIEEVLAEAVLLSRLGHPNLIRVFDADTTETSRGVCGFFTMDYVAGGSLEQFWRSYGARLVPVETVVEIMRQCCRGLAVAHGERPPIVHRDIKPQNILVGHEASGLRVRVSDFGLAKHVNPLTLHASARGTRSFKGPEAFLDYQSDSCAGDVWALGSTMYLLLTDRLPYAESLEVDAFDSDRFKRPLIPPSRLNLNVDPLLDQIVFRALAVTPKDRYPTAQEFLDDLSRWGPRSVESFRGGKTAGSSEGSKTALGPHSSPDEGEARKMANRAIELSRQHGHLAEAADMMEESFNRWPELREELEYWVKLWRKGMSV
jgi:eukaryotic-like serine/threonine-protein kinase